MVHLSDTPEWLRLRLEAHGHKEQPAYHRRQQFAASIDRRVNRGDV